MAKKISHFLCMDFVKMRVFSLAGIQPSPLVGISQSLVWVNPDRLLGEGSLNINSRFIFPSVPNSRTIFGNNYYHRIIFITQVIELVFTLLDPRIEKER